MKKLKWWFIVVGAFYTLLGIANMVGTFFYPAFYANNLPYPAEPAVVKAFVHGWSPFAFEIVGLGLFMLWAARNPRRYLGAVWLIVWLELLHGVVDDIYLIANGFSASGYIPFIVIHLVIIVTGVLFARQAEREAA